MTTISVSDFRSRVSRILNLVEEGEEMVLVRHGRPIARILPVEPDEDHIPSWKTPLRRISVRGASLSQAILEERQDEELY